MAFEKQKELLKQKCGELLKQGSVDLIIGFAADESTGNAVPLFIRTPEDLEKLAWDDSCTPNLSKYLLEKKGRVAIVAKPCDSRAISMYITEGQLDRGNLFIIGMECGGMKHKNSEPAPWCLECDVRKPTVYDILIENDETGENEKNLAVKDAGKQAGEAVSPQDKLSRFINEINKCILCYSCRQACYGCYCGTCFIERGMPDWQPSDLDSGKKMMFHLGRAIHLAGRCVECGACERACPSGVKIRYLVRELTDYCEELYGYRAGMNPEDEPAMTSFKQNDREEGFLGGESNA